MQAMRPALLIKNFKQIAERILWSIQSKNRQTSFCCRFPIAFWIVADVEDFVRLQMHCPQRASKNFRIGFICAEFAGNEDVVEIVGNSQVPKNQSQTAVKI